MSAAHRRRAEYVGEGIRMRLGAAWDGVADYDAGTYILSFGRDTDGSAMNLTEVQAAVAIILAGLESRSLTPSKAGVLLFGHTSGRVIFSIEAKE